MKIYYVNITKNVPPRDTVYLRGLKEKGVQVIEYLNNAPFLIKFWNIYKHHRTLKNDYDLILVGYSAHILVPFINLISRKRIIFNAIGSLYEGIVVSRRHNRWFTPKALYCWLVDYLAFHSADLILAESHQQRKYIQKMFFVSEKRLVRAWTGADDQIFFRDPSVKKLPVFTVLFRGAFMPESGIEHVIEAAKILETEKINFRIIGSGMLESKVEKMINDYGLKKIEWIRERIDDDNIRKLMLETHLSLGQLSNHERLERTIPHKAFESLALGLPYLTAAMPGVLELLKEGETCLTIEPANSRDLANKIIQAKNNPLTLTNIGEQGYNLFQEKLKPVILAKELVKDRIDQVKEHTACRISGEKLTPLFSLGEIHLSNFISPNNKNSIHKEELKLCLAPESGLVQLAHTTPPDLMYSQYWYKSGTNATMTRELTDIALSIQQLMHLKKGDIFIDIGCNDGTLLKNVDKEIVRVGFEPALNIREAEEHADLVIKDYFSAAAYKRSKFSDRKAKAITSIAMFYDLDNLHSFVRDIDEILDDNGLWVIQMSYLPLMLQQSAFDNICHEHVTYFSLSSLKYLLDQHKFNIVDCQLNDTNGGSFRIYIRKQKANPTFFANAPYRDVASYRVMSTLNHEKTLRLDDPKTYSDFYNKILDLREKTVKFIKQEKAKGKTIWGYGASTKGNTLLQWFGLDHTLIDAIAERSPAKFNLVTAGTNIPIYSEEVMREKRPDYLLVLPWHFINEFRQRETEYLRSGGKFIVPCPEFEIIEN